MLNELTYHAILALIVRINQRICIMFCVLAKHCIIFSHRFSYFGYYDKIRNHLFRDPLNFSFPRHFSIRYWKRNFYHEKFYVMIRSRLTLQPLQESQPFFQYMTDHQCFSTYRDNIIFFFRFTLHPLQLLDEKRIKFSVKDNQTLFHPK